MEKEVVKMIQIIKATELFETMAIVNLNMGNLNLEMNSLKNILAIAQKEKATLQEELGKERDFQKEYKHNIGFWRKSMTKNEQKIKMLNTKNEKKNEKLKENIRLMKSQVEELKELREVTKA